MYRVRGLGTIQDSITAAANKYGVPPSLALAVATRESNLNQAEIGTSGEKGVFQLMPGTAAQLGVDPSNLDQNIDGGVRYLSQMFNQFGDWHTALEAYNGGPGNVSRGTVSSAAVSYADALAPAAGSSDVPDSADTGSVLDSWGPAGSLGLSTSPALLAGLGFAAVALIFAVRS